MRGTDARGETVRLPVTGIGGFRHKFSSRSRAAKEAIEVPAIHVVPLNPSDRLVVLYGHPAASRIASQVLIDRSLSGQPVVFLDGIHAFDAFIMGELARSRRQLRKALAMIHVARAFSARQLERLMSHCLADALERYQASNVVIAGLLETLSADVLTANEANRLADRMIESLRHLTQQGFLLLCPCPSVPMPMTPAHRLFAALCSISNRCIRVYELQRKIVTEEIPFNAMSASADPCEGIDAGHPLPFQSVR